MRHIHLLQPSARRRINGALGLLLLWEERWISVKIGQCAFHLRIRRWVCLDGLNVVGCERVVSVERTQGPSGGRVGEASNKGIGETGWFFPFLLHCGKGIVVGLPNEGASDRYNRFLLACGNEVGPE